MKERILRNIMSSISTNTDPTSNVNLLNQKDNGAQTISNNDVFSVYNWKEELESFNIYLARIQIFFPRHICIFPINLPVNSKLKRNVIFSWSEGGGGGPNCWISQTFLQTYMLVLTAAVSHSPATPTGSRPVDSWFRKWGCPVYTQNILILHG